MRAALKTQNQRSFIMSEIGSGNVEVRVKCVECGKVTLLGVQEVVTQYWEELPMIDPSSISIPSEVSGVCTECMLKSLELN